MFFVGNIPLLIIGWEGIRVISFVLIGFWFRNEAVRGAIGAVLYNRIRDMGIIILFLCMDVTISWLFLIVIVMGKSAVWIIGYWLPVAIERPTPVSSLLHSSTMVVAGVVMTGWLMELSVLVGGMGLLLSILFLMSWYDAKKIIAMSTSIHLSVMMIIRRIGAWRLILIHVVVHGLVKASAFVVSGWCIHENGSQDIRVWRIGVQKFVMRWSFLMLTGIRGSLIGYTKEQLVGTIVALWVLIIGWAYTKNFCNIIDGGEDKILLDGGFFVLLFAIGRRIWGLFDVTWLMIVGTGLMIVRNTVGYVVNKG